MLPIRKLSGFWFLLVFKDEGKNGRVKFRSTSIIYHLPVTITHLPSSFSIMWFSLRAEDVRAGRPSVMPSRLLILQRRNCDSEFTQLVTAQFTSPGNPTPKAVAHVCGFYLFTDPSNLGVFLGCGILPDFTLLAPSRFLCLQIKGQRYTDFSWKLFFWCL